MNYKSHIIAGIIFNTIVFGILIHYGKVFNWLSLPLYLFIIYIYSQLPDIDHQSSKIRWVLTVVFIVAALYVLMDGMVTTAILILLGMLFIWVMRYIKWFRHRGVTHTVFANFALSLPFLAYSLDAFLVAVISYQSHILMDRRIK